MAGNGIVHCSGRRQRVYILFFQCVLLQPLRHFPFGLFRGLSCYPDDLLHALLRVDGLVFLFQLLHVGVRGLPDVGWLWP